MPNSAFLSLVSAQATTQASQTQACVAAYGTCRKYQDASVTAVAACNQSPTAVASSLKSITTNKAQVNKAQAAIQSLAKKSLNPAVKELSQLPLLNLRQQQPSYTCADVVFLTNELIGLMDDNPASTLIADVADQLVNATAVASCTADQVAALTTLDNNINTAEAQFDEQLQEFQDTLEGETLGFCQIIHRNCFCFPISTRQNYPHYDNTYFISSKQY